MTDAISFDDVCSAGDRLNGIVHVTPVATSRTLDALSGRTVFLKCENLQRGGAFKFRGAYNMISRMPEDARQHGVVAYSSGNHAQGVALAARLLGAPAIICMPSDAPAVKVEATRGYGAEIVFYDRMRDDRAALAQRIAEERGATLVPPYDHPHIMAGQGTAALELLEQVNDIDTLVVPVGGGTPRSRIGTERYRVDRLVVAVVEPLKVAKHPPIQRSVRLRLMLEVDQQRGGVLTQAHLRHQVSFAPVGVEEVGETLFVKKDGRCGVEGGGQVGRDQVDELAEESGQQQFEQRVVVEGGEHGCAPTGIR